MDRLAEFAVYAFAAYGLAAGIVAICRAVVWRSHRERQDRNYF